VHFLSVSCKKKQKKSNFDQDKGIFSANGMKNGAFFSQKRFPGSRQQPPPVDRKGVGSNPASIENYIQDFFYF
jgi:hypothetical protein